MNLIDPEKIDHRNPCFGENEVKNLCDTFHLSKQLTPLVYIKPETMVRQ